jgi:hypothetical protein
MTTIKTIQDIKSVTEFVTQIIRLKGEKEAGGNNSDFIFRGQPVDKPLQPKLARLQFRIHTNALLKTEELILAEFERGMLPLTEIKPSNDWDLIALAQHHGLPTRLLDWTYSALAALWFAVESPPKKENGVLQNGVVWVLAADSDDFNVDTKSNKSKPFTIKRTKIFRPNIVSRRISAQSGLFTIHYINQDGHIVNFEKHKDFKNKLIKINIPYFSFAKIRKQLILLGINHSTLFPDLDGLTKYLQFRFSHADDEDKDYFIKETQKDILVITP